jgi:integrase
MATFYKRHGARGIRWTARVRIAGREVTRTWPTKAAAEAWARAQETAIDKGEYFAPRPGSGALLADVIDEFGTHRARIGRPPGKTFDNALKRLKKQHGLEPLGNLTVAFWRKHALDRIAKGRSGSTVASELAYAGSVLRHAAREGHSVNADAPGAARTKLREDGVEVVSRQRTRRLTDAELDRLFAWIDANAERTSLPLRDLVEFALATGMRRGEILALERTDVTGRVANIKRKHPRDPNRREDVPLLKPNKTWPRVDPLAIIERQPKGRRVFPYLGDTVAFWFEEALKGAKIDGAVFHLLRHECLSRLAERGFDPLRLAMIGGHRDLKSVKRYAKLDAARLANE